MHYIIYPDTLFLENLICNLLFLGCFKRRFFLNVAWKKIFLAAALTAGSNTFILIMFFHWHWMLQVLLMFPLTGWIVCRYMDIFDLRKRFYLLCQILLWLLVFGGILQMLGQGRMITFQSILLAVLCFTILFTVIGKILSIYERQYTYMREVVLYWDGRSCHFQGYADSGNLLRDPVTKKPVSTISRDAWEDLLKDAKEPCYHRIPYRTIGTGQEMMQVAQIDYMVILKGNDSRVIERPIIGICEQSFAGLFQYSVLLHNEFV